MHWLYVNEEAFPKQGGHNSTFSVTPGPKLSPKDGQKTPIGGPERPVSWIWRHNEFTNIGGSLIIESLLSE